MGIRDNISLIRCIKHLLLPTDNTCHREPICEQRLKISDTTKAEFFELELFESNEKYDKTTAH